MRKRTYIQWKNNPELREALAAEVQATPNKISKVFRRVAKRLKTTPKAISQQWYKMTKEERAQFSVTSTVEKVEVTPVVAVAPVKRKQAYEATDLSNPIHQKIVSTEELDGMRVVTIKQYFID